MRYIVPAFLLATPALAHTAPVPHTHHPVGVSVAAISLIGLTAFMLLRRRFWARK